MAVLGNGIMKKLRKSNKMKELYYRIELPNGTILPHRFERFDQAENYMIRNDIYGYITIA